MSETIITTSMTDATIPNPPDLAPRFEIRRLREEHIQWVAAIVAHSNIYCNAFWTAIYPTNKTSRTYAFAKAADYLVRHQIASNFSFGVFDLEYKYKFASSEKTKGALYWDETGNSEATSEELLQQMDFPLVSVALAYDAIDEWDFPRMMPLMAVIPHFYTVYKYCHDNDPRDPSAYTPTGPKQFLMRNATSTRQDYEGHKCMGALARFLMREAKKAGFRGIGIEAAHDAVAHVWLNPPEPFRGELVCQLDPQSYEEDKEGEEGVKFKPCAPAKQIIKKIWVTL